MKHASIPVHQVCLSATILIRISCRLGFLSLLVDRYDCTLRFTCIFSYFLHTMAFSTAKCSHSFLPFTMHRTRLSLRCTTFSQSMNPTGIYSPIILVQHHLQELEVTTTLNILGDKFLSRELIYCYLAGHNTVLMFLNCLQHPHGC